MEEFSLRFSYVRKLNAMKGGKFSMQCKKASLDGRDSRVGSKEGQWKLSFVKALIGELCKSF